MTASALFAILAFVAAALFGTLGWFVTPPPALMGMLLIAGLSAAVIAVILAERRLVAGGWALLCIALLAAPVLTLFRADSRLRRLGEAPPAPATRRARIVSYNVFHDYPRFASSAGRYRALRQSLLELEPDILLLQESWRTRRHGDLTARLQQDLHLMALSARANGSLRVLGFEEGLAILSRWHLHDGEKLRLAPRQPWWEQRVALRASIDLPGGKTLRVATTHLVRRRPEVAALQARSLLQALAPPTGMAGIDLLGGDLNVGPDSAAIEALREGGLQPVVSARLDHILVHRDSEFCVDRSLVVLDPDDRKEETPLSDHPALVVDLSW